MQIDTKYFGPVEYEHEDLLTFPNGLFGFESEHRFLPLPFAGSNGSLLCLQSVSTPALAFVVMDPFSLCPDYSPVLSPEELQLLGAEESGELGYSAIRESSLILLAASFFAASIRVCRFCFSSSRVLSCSAIVRSSMLANA